MSKRKNSGKVNKKSKSQKLDDVHPNEIVALVDDQNRDLSPAIFKLNDVCSDDLFDWLSLNDLDSLGLTCDRMNRLTGNYF